MKVARIQSSDGLVHFATPVQNNWFKCSGDLQNGWTETNEPVQPVAFLPPVQPAGIFGIGLNYKAHALEMGKPLPEFPVVFMKNISAACGHLSPVMLPRFLTSDTVDYEVELAIVIGKACKNINLEDALHYVAGYTVANDISARDWQNIYGGGQWSRAKSFDTFCPLGPVMVSADEIPDPNNLRLCLELNGVKVQDSSTSDMIFNVQQIIHFLSGSTTVLPGTVILTGTPSGVGASRNPPRYLQANDHLAAEIEGIGRLENTVENERI